MECMRFIRTADGRIIDVSGLELISAADGYAGEGIGRYGDSVIVKAADAVKDLCDRFVLIDRNEYDDPIDEELIGKRYEAMAGELIFRLGCGSDIRKMAFYGAVWTDKGLIYAAKMDGEGREFLIDSASRIKRCAEDLLAELLGRAE